jgi:hypothetical protein
MNYAFVGAKLLLREPIIDDRSLRKHLDNIFSAGNSGSSENPWSPVRG